MLVDDDAGLLEALADSVRSTTDLELVATATDGAQAIERALDARPDVAVMDARMPGLGGVSATRELSRRMPELRIVGLSAHEDQGSALEMIDAGAIGYIVKGAPEPEVLEAVRRAYRGQMSMQADLGVTALRDLLRELKERRDTEQALRKSEQRNAALLESIPDSVVVVGDDGTIELVSGQTARLFGYGRGELIGQPVEVLVPERYRRVHEAKRERLELNQHSRPMDSGLDFSARRKDGTEFPADISLAHLETDEGTKTIAAIRDITSRTLAGDAQRKSEQLFRGLLESAPDAMVIIDANGLIQVVNAQAERVFGYPRGELRGQSVDTLLPERFRPAHLRHRLGYMERPQARPMGAELDLYGRRRDGTEFPVDISLSPMESESGPLVIAAVRDVTDRREAKKKLDETLATAQRQQLFARLIAAQEEERLRIASDIHDDTIQAMTATSLRMQQLRRHLSDPSEIDLLKRLEEAVRESITRLRRLMFDLRPAALDRSGLAAALRELLQRLQDESDIAFVFDNQLDVEPDGEVRTALYRIAQEALTNVKKHSGAVTVHVELRTVGNGCRIRITDDGHGFDVKGADMKPGHLGLVSMRERAQIAGGWWSVKCPPGLGTVVEFWMPVGKEGARPATPVS